MHAGLSLFFQNLDDAMSDSEVMAHGLDLASRAEATGFDSVWTPEHHFAGYMLTPAPPQFLAWVAGQTSTVKLGTMVTVLPWHDPIRVAESFTLLDHLSGGRAILGLGRGLGRSEFEGFGTPMGESRRRFTEYSEAIVNALETGVMEFDGELYKQPPVAIRPAPYASFRNRTFASAISPASMDLMIKLRAGLMVIAQKPWEKTEAELVAYAERFQELNGFAAPKPILCVMVCVNEDAAEAQRMRDVYIQNYARSTVDHYEFANVGFAEIEGYEYYSALANNIAKHGIEKFNGFLGDLQVWGTPDQVTERILDYVKRTNAGGVLSTLSFGGMPIEEANANFELYSREVLPVLKAHDVGGDVGVTHDATVGSQS